MPESFPNHLVYVSIVVQGSLHTKLEALGSWYSVSSSPDMASRLVGMWQALSKAIIVVVNNNNIYCYYYYCCYQQ